MTDAHHPKLLLLGGFLGAGKTTAIVRLASMLAAGGKRVAVVANDQAANLVDSASFRAAGLPTSEVAGGCFCCRFDELVAAAGRLVDGSRPDVVLAEPVGSCTDLVATVIRPLQQFYGDLFTVAPYLTLLDPDRAWQALSGTGPAAFSAKVTYIFKMQQHEADLVAVNKIDLVTPDRRAALLELVAKNFPKARVLAISARTGEGFDELLQLVGVGGTGGGNLTDVDYDLYADGEAELGWLNAEVEWNSNAEVDGDELLLELLGSLRERFQRAGVEPAHVKATLGLGDQTGVANLVNGERPPELSRRSGLQGRSGRLTVNARVQTAPEPLQQLVEGALSEAMGRCGATFHFADISCFSPSRPVPTHRLTSP